MPLAGEAFRSPPVAVGVVSAAVGLALSACGTSAAPSAAGGAGVQVGSEQSPEAGSELAYEDVGACTARRRGESRLLRRGRTEGNLFL